MNPKISFAITTHNEGEYIRELLVQLVPFCMDTGDEIVIVDDYSIDETTVEILKYYSAHCTIHYRSLNNDFASHKNFLNSKCHGEFIFQVDADETISPTLLENIHTIVEINSHLDLIFIPRVNIVNGLEDEDIARWGWHVNEYGWVNFPDYQTRLYRNDSSIMWMGNVHERIVGFKSFNKLPDEEQWSLYHTKSIDRQRRQNNFYETL